MKRVKIILTERQLNTIWEALDMLAADYDQACDGEFGDNSKRTPTAKRVLRNIASVRKTVSRFSAKAGLN